METRPGDAGVMVPMASIVKALPLPHPVQSRSGDPRASVPSERITGDEVAMKIPQ